MATVLWPDVGATTRGRQISWEMERDKDGHRNYKIEHLVRADTTDGPGNVLRTPGLPLPGAVWVVDGEVDLFAFCQPETRIKQHQHKKGDKHNWWAVENLFSTRPPANQRCSELDFEDPISEPDRVSGSFTKYNEEATTDYLGLPIVNSAWERIRGPQVEFDSNRPTVTIEQNVPWLGWPFLTEIFFSMLDTVNSFPMWGLPVRCVKLSNVSWDRKFYGLCFYYYTRRLEFDIRYPQTHPLLGLYGGFDRIVLDEGTKVIRGEWDYDLASATYGEYVAASGVSVFDPRDFVRYKDWYGENTRAVLNGAGAPAASEALAGGVLIQKYYQSDLTVFLRDISTIFLGY